MVGLKGLSISENNLEKVKMKTTNFFILSTGSVDILEKRMGAAEMLLA